MTNILNKKRKKKGFTLIELVIVLAVLAIIALIAIPNFTKVRNDSLTKADMRSGEQIEKITLMAIANQDIIVPESGSFSININGDKTLGTPSDSKMFSSKGKESYTSMIQEIKKPQVNGKTAYKITVKDDGSVVVTYSDNTSITNTK
ncbi:type II secretion system protein [Clostridium mediterraneense]|uniref:type II secretion system protein n=1 Tax=Clostridium mediterraneense TaxID=1805472 RepID=UPI00082F35FC|nr:type II secretion system protein [Clostridium mediterraneense]